MANRNRTAQGLKAIRIFAVTALLASCAVTAIQPLPGIPELKDQPHYDIPNVELLSTSPEMKRFVNRHAFRQNNPRASAWNLSLAAMSPDLLRFEYDPQITLPADQAFSEGIGNCLTFSAIMVAMAREAGLRAHFQEVEILPEWSNVNDTMLVSKHVNAVVYQSGQEYTVDVSRRRSKTGEYTQRLSDAEAQAQFYNNLGADALIGGNIGLAYAYFTKGLEMNPRLGYIWSNIGVILRRNGQTDDAILAYRTALKLDRNQPVALTNLYVIYTEDENEEAAEEFRVRVERNQRRNPFYIQALAEEAIEEQHYSQAEKLAKKAIKMRADEYRFHYTLARARYFSGKATAAQESLERARELAPTTRERTAITLPPG